MPGARRTARPLLQAQSPGCGGRLELHQTTPVVGKQWTDTGDRHEKRGLKNRPGRAIRIVPIPGELVAILRAHIAQYGQAPDGRLFRSEHGGVLHPSGHSVEVLLTIYAKSIEGRDRVWFERIDQALGGGPV